jgi:short-subunit dehydrogenase
MKPAIVVTGAASGIGRELARIAAREGSVMVLVDQSQQLLDNLAVEFASSDIPAHAICVDLACRDAGQRVESRLSELGVYCDVLVNSAGIALIGTAAQLDREEQLRLLDVNARALTDLTIRVLPGMIARRHGGILNVGSICGYVPGPNMAAYYASKAYVRSFTAAIAAEVAGTGVTVTCLSPGIVRTDLFKRGNVGQMRILKLMPRASAPATANAGWRAFRAGKTLVVPGLTNRMILALRFFLPEALTLRLLSTLQRPL